MAKSIEITVDRSEPTNWTYKKKPQSHQLVLMQTRADRAMRLIIKRKLKSYDVGVMEWLLLGVVKGGPNTGMSMGAIANAMGCSMPQVNSITTKLVNRRLIQQKSQRHDHRVQRVTVNAKGRALYAAAEQEIDKELGSWLAVVPENYMVFYRRVLQRIASTEPSV